MNGNSAIYIRYEGKLWGANGYSSVDGIDLISHARYGIQHLKHDIDSVKYEGSNPYHATRRFFEGRQFPIYSCIFDVNFDQKDVSYSWDIIQDFKDCKIDNPKLNFKSFCFDRQYEAGWLLIDITGYSVKYAFLDDKAGYKHIMTAEQYINWFKEIFPRHFGFISTDKMQVCADNIQAIDSMAQLMTGKEVLDYFQTEHYYTAYHHGNKEHSTRRLSKKGVLTMSFDEYNSLLQKDTDGDISIQCENGKYYYTSSKGNEGAWGEHQYTYIGQALCLEEPIISINIDTTKMNVVIITAKTER